MIKIKKLITLTSNIIFKSQPNYNIIFALLSYPNIIIIITLYNIKSKMLQSVLRNSDKHFLKRWPTTPKVAFFGPPNVFMEEITTR